MPQESCLTIKAFQDRSREFYRKVDGLKYVLRPNGSRISRVETVNLDRQFCLGKLLPTLSPTNLHSPGLLGS
jgi:hypothetical protein